MKTGSNIRIVNPRQLLSVSLKLGLEACRIIKDSYMNKNIKQYSKGIDNPVTEADFKVQSMLIKGYRQCFPSMAIVGEEESEYQGSIDADFSDLTTQSIPDKIQFGLQYQQEECCLWVDPIDNTRGFIEGEIEAVTTLIGLSHQSKAEFGVIAIPFKRNKERVYYHPSLLFGSVHDKIAYEYFPRENRWINLNAAGEFQRYRKRIVMSGWRENLVEKQIAERLGMEILHAGGSGFKMAMIAKREAEMMAYCLSNSMKWDTCAGQAIVEAQGGKCTTSSGSQVLYNKQNPKQSNSNGILCSIDQNLLQQCVQIYNQVQTQKK